MVRLVNLTDEEADAAILKMRRAGLTDAEILLCTLYENTRELRKHQRVYYRTKEKGALTKAIHQSEALDQMLEDYTPVVSKIMERIA